MKKFLIGFAVLGATIALFATYSFPVATRDCSNEPTPECLKEAIQDFNYRKHLEQTQYQYYGDLLVQTGLHKEGLNLLRDSESSLVSGSIYQMAAMQIAEEAMTHPDKVASFKPLERLMDPATVEGAILADRGRANRSTGYMHVTHILIGPDSGAGDSNYVQYNEKSSARKFRPNQTWHAVVSAWRYEVDGLSEPYRSGTLLILVSVLSRVGENEQAYEILESAKPDKQNSLRYVRELEKLDKRNAVRTIRERYRPRYENLIAYAKWAIEAGDSEQAKTLLVEAVDELIHADIPDFSGKDRGKALRKASLMLHTIGAQEEAVGAADKSYQAEKDGPISRSFINRQEIAAHYRAIGALDKSRSHLGAAASKPPCSPFSGLERVAREYYLQGDIEAANNKISQMCGSVSVFGSMFGIRTAKIDKEKIIQNFWKGLYVEALASGKDVEAISRFMDDETIQKAASDLAMYFLNHGQEELGQQYLETAINSGNVSCNLAYLANSADREDLVKQHMIQAIGTIGEEYSGLDRQAEYLRLAACHNKIRIDRLRQARPKDAKSL